MVQKHYLETEDVERLRDIQ